MTTEPIQLYRSILFRIVDHPFTVPESRWHITNERGQSITTHRTRLEAADQYVTKFAELTGTWPDESETADDGRIVYSMDDGSALVVMFDGTVRHYPTDDEPNDGLDSLSPNMQSEYEQASLRG